MQLGWGAQRGCGTPGCPGWGRLPPAPNTSAGLDLGAKCLKPPPRGLARGGPAGIPPLGVPVWGSRFGGPGSTGCGRCNRSRTLTPALGGAQVRAFAPHPWQHRSHLVPSGHGRGRGTRVMPPTPGGGSATLLPRPRVLVPCQRRGRAMSVPARGALAQRRCHGHACQCHVSAMATPVGAMRARCRCPWPFRCRSMSLRCRCRVPALPARSRARTLRATPRAPVATRDVS